MKLGCFDLMKEKNILRILHETLHAEHGSALEMLAACKATSRDNLVYGYFEHAKDEYIHTKTFKKILATRIENTHVEIARNYRFTPIGIIKKGYVDNNGFLIETLKLKDFVAYVYTNELLAKKSFERILKLIKDNKRDFDSILDIMKDELRHHGMAREYFLKYYPNLQPYHLFLYKLRETIKNKTRRIYYKNIEFLEIIFKPLYSLLALLGGYLLLKFNHYHFYRENINLMDISSKSLL